MARSNGRILIVEDDPLLAGMMVDFLLAEDYEVDGPYASVRDGMAALATHMPDGAVVDLHHRLHWLRLRYLRAADAAAHHQAGDCRAERSAR